MAVEGPTGTAPSHCWRRGSWCEVRGSGVDLERRNSNLAFAELHVGKERLVRNDPALFFL